MAKAPSGLRMLRSLTRAARSQQRLVKTLLAAYPGARTTPPRKRRSPAAPGTFLSARLTLPDRAGAPAQPFMHYWLYLPQQAPETGAQQGWPLIVMLHGCHQDAVEFAEGTGMNRLAEKKGCAVLYPQQAGAVQAQRCWRWYDRATQHGGGDTLALAALIADVCARYPIDTRRVYACGLSAGAGMAAVLALNHPELIAAIGLHSAPVFGAGHSPLGALQVMRHGTALHAATAIDGVLQRRALQATPGNAAPMPALPALLIQGEDDRVVRPVNQQQLARQWLQLHGLPPGATPRVTHKAAGRGGSRNAHAIHDYLVGRKLLLRVASIAGLGHAWSGGDARLKFNAGAGPDASRMMLDFVGRHRR